MNLVLKHSPSYYIVCIHVSNVRSSITATEIELEKLEYTKARNMIGALYGRSLRKIIFDSNAIARKFVDNFALPVDLQPIPQAKITVVENGSKVISDVAITSEGVTSSGQLVFKFTDAVHCRVRTNLLYVPEVVRSFKRQLNRNCCMRFMGGSNFE